MEQYKVVFIGDTRTCKTAYATHLAFQCKHGNRHANVLGVHRWSGDYLGEKHSPTLGVEVHPYILDGAVISIWDCAGKEEFGGLRDGYYIAADGAVVFAQNFKSAGKWIRAFKRVVGNAPIVIIDPTEMERDDVPGQASTYTLLDDAALVALLGDMRAKRAAREKQRCTMLPAKGKEHADAEAAELAEFTTQMQAAGAAADLKKALKKQVDAAIATEQSKNEKGKAPAEPAPDIEALVRPIKDEARRRWGPANASRLISAVEELVGAFVAISGTYNAQGGAAGSAGAGAQ